MKSFTEHTDSFECDYAESDNLISEAGLSRLLSGTKEDSFAIITAYRGGYTKEQNIKRNRDLRGDLNAKKMGVIPLVGHWQECEDSSIEDYKKCPKHQLKDVIERSYFVKKPDNVSTEDFKKFIAGLNKKYEQDGAVFKDEGNMHILDKTGNYVFTIGNTVSLGKVAQAYSQYVKKMNVPFVFEGVEFAGTNIGRMIAKNNGYANYIPEHNEEVRKLKDLI